MIATSRADDARNPWHLESVDIYLNAACNLSCTSCFLGDAYFDDSRMSIEQVTRILDWAVVSGAQEVALLGGEPTLHPELATIIRAAQERMIQRIRLVSNGGPSFRAFLKKPEALLVDAYYLSLDGATAETHDAIRGAGSFRHLMRSFDLTRTLGLSTVATITIGRSNSASVEAIIELGRSLGAARANIHWMSPTGRATEADSLSSQEWTSIVARVLSIRESEDYSIDIQAAYSNSDDDDLHHCSVRNRSNLQFMPSGAVHACGLTVSDSRRSAYVWNDNGLAVRNGHTEAAACLADTSALGCPLRPAQPAGVVHSVPLCIYLRRSALLPVAAVSE